MARRRIFVISSGLALFVLGSSMAQEASRGDMATTFSTLLSGNKADREVALAELETRQRAVHSALTRVLQESLQKHRDDAKYKSPLHSAILAVDAGRVFEAEDFLLSVIDYQLDARSLPDGLDVSGDYFYPAARTLSRLRVNTAKITEALVVRASDDRQIKLLTWLLAERAGSLDEAKRILVAGGRNQNLQNAIGFVDRIEHASELLRPVEKPD